MSEPNANAEPDSVIPLPDRRFQRLLLLPIAGFCLSAGLVYPFPLQGWPWNALFDLAHGPTFFALFVLIAGILDPGIVGLSGRFPPIMHLGVRHLLVLAALLCGIGVFGELAQMLVARQPSFQDVAANCTGLFAALCWCISRRILRKRSRVVLLVMTAALLLLPNVFFILQLQEWMHKRNDFPLLASFERPRELSAWQPHQAKVRRVTEWASHGTYAMQIVQSRDRKFPGATMIWPMPDWSASTQLKVDIHNPQDTELAVGISIADSDHSATGFEPSDRFSRIFVVPPASTQTITIELREVEAAPETHVMKMNNVSFLDIFMRSPKGESKMFVDNLRLIQ